MAKRITVVVSQGQSANPEKRRLEEDLVAALLMERGIEVTVIPHLYDLQPTGTGMLCLQGITGDMIVASWLYPRAAFWTLDRAGVRGRFGTTLLTVDGDSDDEDETNDSENDDDKPRVVQDRPAPNRTIYCVDLRAAREATAFVAEIKRIVQEASVQTYDLLGWIGGAPQPAQMERFLHPTANNVAHAEHSPAPAGANGHAPTAPSDAPADSAAAVLRISEEPHRRWYPVIDYSRCTNCMECLDFCLFGVYGVDRVETILVEQPDNCRKGCPACSRVCPENAIIFPQHKTPAIAGSPEVGGGSFKIDLSKLFGAPEGLDAAVAERDAELVAAGRDAVGTTVGLPKRQSEKPTEAKDDLDRLMDQLDLDL